MIKKKLMASLLLLAITVVAVIPGNGTVFAAAGVVFTNVPCDSPGSGTISNVTATSTEIIVTGWIRTSQTQNLDLFALEPYEDHTLGVLETKTAVINAAVNPGGIERCYNYTATVERYDGSSKDRIYSKFAVALRNGAGALTLVDGKHVTTFTEVALNSFAFPISPTKKGLQVQLIDDAQELGIGHAALNFSTGDLLHPTEGSNTITYTMNGENFYFDKQKIEENDRAVKSLSDNGVIVSLILLVFPSYLTSPSNLILHPDSNGGIVGAFNTKDANMKYFQAVSEFIVERYTRSDQLYGRAVNYIIGNEVNSYSVWYNMGVKTLQEFVKDYVRTLRVFHTAAMKKYSNARVYISLDHFWTITGGDYQGKEVIDEINTQATALGNFPWNVAYHPYPENLGVPQTWNDTTATDSFTTPRITFKNIQILTQYLDQTAFKYNGASRRVILSEQGFHTMDPTDADDQRLQAAAYAYGYYKTLFNSSIDSFILHRHVDNGGEGGLNLGLWTRNTTTGIPNDPDAKKKMWSVMKQIDTADSVNATDFAKGIIGISDWADVIPGYNASQLNVRTPPAVTDLYPITAGGGTTMVIADFDTNTEGWTKADYTDSVARVTSSVNLPGTPYQGTGMLEAAFNTTLDNDGAASWKGVTKTFTTPLDLSSNPYLQLALNSFGGAPSATRYYAKVRLYSGSNILEGQSEITPDSWNLLGMNVSQWTGKNSIDRIKIWFRTDSGAVWDAGFYVDYIAASQSVSYKHVQGEFNTNGDTEGWIVENNVTGLTATNGSLQGTLSGSDPYVTKYGIEINSAINNKVIIRMKNSTNATKGKLYWTTSLDGTRSESKSQEFNITANDSQFREYIVDLSGKATWANTIMSLRLDPADNSNGSGSFTVDYIRLLPNVYPHWDYSTNNDLMGWNTLNMMTASVSGGTMTQTLTGADPYMLSPIMAVDAGKYKVIQFKIRNNTSATKGKIYWIRTGDASPSEQRQKQFTVTANDTAEQIYTIRMDDETLWNGTIKNIRMDFADNSSGTGTIAVDYISLPIYK